MNVVSRPTKDERQQFRRQKELKRLEKEYQKPKKFWKWYLAYMMLILALIYVVDEVATNLPNSLQTEINLAINVWPWAQHSDPVYSLTTIWDQVYPANGTSFIQEIQQKIASGLCDINLVHTLANLMLIASMFYRSLSDRYGRKIFLFINTFGLALSLLVFFSATNFVGYVIGFFCLRFFVTPDQQVVYIFELAPKKYRNAIFSSIKGIAEFGLVFIWLLRKIFLTADPNSLKENDIYDYKWIFLTVAIAAIIISFLALLFSRESDAFLEQRISYLKKTPEELEELKKQKDASKAQGGFLSALKYTFHNKQVLFICIATAIAELCYSACNNYSSILTYGFLGEGGLTQETTTAVTFFFPFSCALVTFAYGFVSDWIGRKKTSILLLSFCTLCFILEFLGLYYGWPAWVIGLLLGGVLGADWANGDVLSLMAGESAPTNIRSSVMSAWSTFFGIGMILSYGISALVPKLAGTTYLSLAYLCISLPSWIISLIILMLFVKETRGIDIHTKTGETSI